MKRLNAKQILYLLGLVLGAGLFVYQLGLGMGSLKSINFQWSIIWQLFGIVGLLALALLLQILDWQIVLRGLEINIPFIDVSKGYVYSFLPRYIPGSVWGYLSRGEWMKREHGVSYSLTNLASILEILITFISGLMVLALAFTQTTGVELVYRICLIVLLPIIIWFVIKLTIKRITQSDWHWKHLLTPLLVVNLKTWLVWILFYSIHLIVEGLGLFLTIQLFWPEIVVGINIGSILISASIFSLGWMIGLMVIFVPAGLGVREVIVTGLINMVFGVNWEISALIATFFRLNYMIAEMIWLLWGVLSKGITWKNR